MPGAKHVRNGCGAVRPYLYVTPDMIEFVQSVFGAVVEERHDMPNGSHVECKVGDSSFVLEVADTFPSHVEVTVASVYLYVTDVDAVYAAALEAGAESIAPPEDKPYAERQCGIKDLSGNTWWIATFTGAP